MTLRLTAAELDCLVQASERPVPVPLPVGAGAVPVNPMVFPVDWGFGCRLTTRWLTDVTRSLDRCPEKWALSSRPARSLEVTVIGASREEAAAMQMASLEMSTKLGMPVPIYPDMAELTAVSMDGSTCTVGGDFRYRRFFVGGRVCFMPNQVSPAQQNNSVVFGTISEISPSQLKVSLIAEAMRTITLSDVAFPCMDVELVEKSSGLSITDAVYQLTLSWNELEGESALPPSWPFVSAADAETAQPLCRVVDNLPVFPFNPDWSDGVEISIERDTGSDKSGRTTIQEPRGKPYHRFDLSVMGYNREACWKVGRFFDAVRGRAAAFYFIHPQSPWSLTTFPTLSQVSIKAVGSLTSLSHYKRAAFFRADGSFVVREITNATELSGIFVLQLASALPDTSFVSVQPVFICSFDQDALDEAWSTTTVVPAFRLTFTEEPVYGTASVPSLGYIAQPPSFQSIPGCDLLFRAGSGCLTPLGARSSVWSGSDDRVGKMLNLAASNGRDPLGFVPSKFFQEVSPGPATRKHLIRFPVPFQNNGQPTVRGAYFDLPYMLDTSVPIAQRHLWSASGWTLCICWTPKARGSALTQPLFQITSPEVVMQMNYDTSGASGAGRSRLTVDGISYLLTTDLEEGESARILTIHFLAGVLRIWVNGIQACASGLSVPLAIPSSYSVSRWFQFIDSYTAGQPSSSALATMWGTLPGFNLLASYNRGLSVEEVNQLHSLVSDLYVAPNTPSVLF